jgi:hypothetical protein
MQRFLLTSTLLCFFTLLCAQQPSLLELNQNRLQKQKVAMSVLGTWAIGNIAAGLALQSNREGAEKYFHQMNAGWNAVNLAIAGFGYWGVMRTDPGNLGLFESWEEQHKFQKILLFNAGLDIGYMAGGAYLWERSRREGEANPARLEGFGKSIILQGAFLFAFDLTTYFILAADNKDWAPLLSQFDLEMGLNQIGLTLRF